ncbi:MAG TPA: hypothetical protein VFE24_01925 [Pirellulales bacterium]|jgi:hypothetical protein|nr:hypothetical protein [Pirellulales bacterium]
MTTDSRYLLQDAAGIWYAVEVQRLDPWEKVFPIDVFLREPITFERANQTYGRAVFALRKTQLSSRAIRKFGLTETLKTTPQFPRRGKRHRRSRAV